MVDTHSHILWGLDDGPQSRGEALAICLNAVADGVETIVATPHVSRRYRTDFHLSRSRCDELSAALAGDGVALNVVLGAEVTAGLVASLGAEALRRWSIGGRHLLVEVDNSWSRRTPDLMAAILRDAGLTPLWAHPERWHAVHDDPALGRVLARRGQIQVTAPSLLGLVGRRAHAASWRLVSEGTASLVASDVHGTRVRPQSLGDAATLVEAAHGSAARERLFETAPRAVVAADGPSPRSAERAPAQSLGG